MDLQKNYDELLKLVESSRTEASNFKRRRAILADLSKQDTIILDSIKL